VNRVVVYILQIRVHLLATHVNPKPWFESILSQFNDLFPITLEGRQIAALARYQFHPKSVRRDTKDGARRWLDTTH
tara:strand:+ start:712 stop:939 length:228 start_codon:yes stop_codon:yes gene_type:complete